MRKTKVHGCCSHGASSPGQRVDCEDGRAEKGAELAGPVRKAAWSGAAWELLQHLGMARFPGSLQPEVIRGSPC